MRGIETARVAKPLTQYTLLIITSQLYCFRLRTTLNGKAFKGFFSWAMVRKAEHPSTHARKKFWSINMEHDLESRFSVKADFHF